MTHQRDNEWVLLVDDDNSQSIVETVVDIKSSSESGYTSEEALADEILGGQLQCGHQQENEDLSRSSVLISNSFNFLSTHQVISLLIANVLVLVTYICFRGRFLLPNA